MWTCVEYRPNLTFKKSHDDCEFRAAGPGVCPILGSKAGSVTADLLF